MVVKDEGVQDTDGTVYALEDGRRDGEQEGSQVAMAGFGQVSRSRGSRMKKKKKNVSDVRLTLFLSLSTTAC